MSKVNIVKTVQDEDFKVLLQDHEGYLFMHCYVYEYKPSVARKFRKLIKELLEWADSEYYDGIHAVTENKKFTESIKGARFIEDIDYQGQTRGVYKWDLTQSV